MGAEDCAAISATGLKILDTLLNNLKCKTLQILKNLMAFLSDKNYQHYLLEVSKFSSSFENNLRICLGSLFTICKNNLYAELAKIAFKGTVIICFG